MEQSTFLLGLVKLPRDVRIERVRRLEEKVEGISNTEVYESSDDVTSPWDCKCIWSVDCWDGNWGWRYRPRDEVG